MSTASCGRCKEVYPSALLRKGKDGRNVCDGCFAKLLRRYFALKDRQRKLVAQGMHPRFAERIVDVAIQKGALDDPRPMLKPIRLRVTIEDGEKVEVLDLDLFPGARAAPPRLVGVIPYEPRLEFDVMD